MSQLDWKGRKVLITGGARGIGFAIAEDLKAQGAEVFCPTRKELDLSDLASVKAFLTSPPDVDTLINNAGENIINPLDRILLEDWMRMMNVNLNSCFLLTQGLAEGMKRKHFGRIVNVSSVYGIVSRSGRAAYTASKAGLIGLTRTSAIELGAYGVLVNAVCPGFVETDLTRKNNTPEQLKALCSQTALGRLAEPTELAKAVRFLASEENTFMTGQAIVIDGGFSCM